MLDVAHGRRDAAWRLTELIGGAAPDRLTLWAETIRVLHLDPRSYIARRTDRTRLHDIDSVDWTTIMEIRLPSLSPAPTGLFPVPLLTRSKSITTCEITDDDGRSIALVSWGDSRRILTHLLVSRARWTLHKGAFEVSSPILDLTLKRLLRELLDDLAVSGAAFNRILAWARLWLEPAPTAPNLQADVPDPWSDVSTPLQREQAAALFLDLGLGPLIREFASGNLVLALLPYEPGVRRRVVVRHHQALATPGHARSRTGSGPPMLTLPAGSAASYHAEVDLPPGVRFTDKLRMLVRGLPPSPVGDDAPPSDLKRALAVADGESHLITKDAYGGSPPADGWRVKNDESTLTIHAVSSRRDASLALCVDRCLRVAKGGIGTLAVRLSFALAAVFVVGDLLRVGRATPEGEGVAGVILALLSAFTAFVLGGEEWRTQRRVALGPRASLTTAIVLGAGGAGTLAVKFPAATSFAVGRLGWGWRGFAWACLSVAAAGLFAVTVWLNRRW